MIVTAQHLLHVSHETKLRSTPDLSAPGQCPAAECFLLLVGLECCSVPQRLASFAGSAGGQSRHCLDPVFGVIS